MVVRKFRVFIAYFLIMCFTFLIGGLIFEFFLIHILFMLTVDSGYQLPKVERFIFLAKFICLVSPVGALIATVLLDRK